MARDRRRASAANLKFLIRGGTQLVNDFGEKSNRFWFSGNVVGSGNFQSGSPMIGGGSFALVKIRGSGFCARGVIQRA
jgi:hypothetical protein